jgi:hypothetical protein
VRRRSGRSTPVWVPNPVDGVVLFLLEAAIVLALGLIGIAVASLALWIF